MGRGEELLAEFREDGVPRGTTIYFYRTTALEIVARCEALRIDLLGMEGFFVTDKGTHPQLDWVLDLSISTRRCDVARRYLTDAAGLPLFVEIVLGEEGP